MIASIVVAGCAGDRNAPTVPEFRAVDLAAVLLGPETPQLVQLRTYDGSGQSAHPDFVAPPASPKSRLLYLVLTPFPGGGTKHENPSLYAGLDGIAWGAAPGAPMPLVRPQQGYLSDPDIVFDPSAKEFVLYYRQASSSDRIFVMRSPNAVAWSNPAVVLTSQPGALLSPAVVRRSDRDWIMWSVNGAPGCRGKSTTVEMRRSTDGQTWSAPERVDLPVQQGQFVWHIDVQWIESRGEYWALFPVKTPGTCVTTSVYLATSRDGVAWQTVPAPVLVAGAIPEFQNVVYRSTFAFDAATDEVTIWYSGARVAGKAVVWRSAVQRRLRAELLDVSPFEARQVVPAASQELSASFDPP